VRTSDFVGESWKALAVLAADGNTEILVDPETTRA
jgi:hypothetical protein